MKLTIKNLKQVEFKIEVDDAKLTIKQTKKEIEKVHGFDASCMKLLFNGTVLEDEKTLEDYKINDEYVLIMICHKKKLEEDQNKNQSQNQSSYNQRQPKTNASSLPSAADYSSQIETLVEMGYKRDQIIPAITAAKGNIELTVQFLHSGIPISLTQNNNSSSSSNNNSSNFGGDANRNNNGNSTASTTTTTTTFNINTNTNTTTNATSNLPSSINIDNLTLLEKTASCIKVICSRDSSRLPVILDYIKHKNTILFQVIKESQNQFRELLNRPITHVDFQVFSRFHRELGIREVRRGQQVGQSGSGSSRQHRNDGGIGSNNNSSGSTEHRSGAGRSTIRLTNEENEAVKRLCSLGNFDKSEVLQLYFACDKNEELTANMLFEKGNKSVGENIGNVNNSDNKENKNGNNGTVEDVKDVGDNNEVNGLINQGYNNNLNDANDEGGDNNNNMEEKECLNKDNIDIKNDCNDDNNDVKIDIKKDGIDNNDHK